MNCTVCNIVGLSLRRCRNCCSQRRARRLTPRVCPLYQITPFYCVRKASCTLLGCGKCGLRRISAQSTMAPGGSLEYGFMQPFTTQDLCFFDIQTASSLHTHYKPLFAHFCASMADTAAIPSSTRSDWVTGSDMAGCNRGHSSKQQAF